MMEQYLPKKQQLDQRLDHYCVWFWRIVLLGFVVMILLWVLVGTTGNVWSMEIVNRHTNWYRH